MLLVKKKKRATLISLQDNNRSIIFRRNGQKYIQIVTRWQLTEVGVIFYICQRSLSRCNDFLCFSLLPNFSVSFLAVILNPAFSDNWFLFCRVPSVIEFSRENEGNRGKSSASYFLESHFARM